MFNMPMFNVIQVLGECRAIMALVSPEKNYGVKTFRGGHLTHGHPKITFPGKFLRVCSMMLTRTA